MSKNTTLTIKGNKVVLFQQNDEEYISLTDIAKTKENDSRAADVIKKLDSE